MKKLLSIAFLAVMLEVPSKAEQWYTNAYNTNWTEISSNTMPLTLGTFGDNYSGSFAPPGTNILLTLPGSIHVFPPVNDVTPAELPGGFFDLLPAGNIDFTNGAPDEISFRLQYVIILPAESSESYTAGDIVVGLSWYPDWGLWLVFYLADTRFPYARPPEE